VVIEHQHGIIVHGDAVIGDDCILRHGVTIGNRTLDRPHDAPRIGDGVNIGAGAKILGGVVVGDGAQIGANSVVVNDVPPHSTATGIPARVTRTERMLRRSLP
jgi:serine O-acetyltransferase